jgi:hypothetical protein
MEPLDDLTKIVLYKCREINSPITEALASFLIQTIINPRTHKFFFEEDQKNIDKEFIISETLKKLRDLHSPAIKTIELQIGQKLKKIFYYFDIFLYNLISIFFPRL